VREQRRQVRLERRARAIAGRESSLYSSTNNSPRAKEVQPLGVSLGGDLPPSWRAGKYVVLPDHAARLPELAIGQSGAGKSTYMICMTVCDACELLAVLPVLSPAEEAARVREHGKHVGFDVDAGSPP